MWEVPEDFELERITCYDCKNSFFIEHMGEIQELNRPDYCPYCGVEFLEIDFETDEEG